MSSVSLARQALDIKPSASAAGGLATTVIGILGLLNFGNGPGLEGQRRGAILSGVALESVFQGLTSPFTYVLSLGSGYAESC